MDELARQLREDAGRIDVAVSPELDARIRASLHGTRPERPTTARPESAPWRYWLATTITGGALAAALIVVVNLQVAEPEVAFNGADLAAIEVPDLRWRVEPAVLTSPLEEEYERLQSDIEKAEKAIMEGLEGAF